MTRIRNDRTGRQQRRAATLMLAGASGGLLAAAMAASPAARADDPYSDIANYVQNAITIGQGDYSDASTDFSTASGTNAGLIAEFAAFDNTFIAPGQYTLLGLTAAGTGTNFSGFGSFFDYGDIGPVTVAGEQADAATYFGDASAYFTDATSLFSSGEYFYAAEDDLLVGYYDILGGQSDALAGLFSLGL